MTEIFVIVFFLKDKFLFTDFFAFEEIGLKKLSIWHNIRKKRLFINLFLVKKSCRKRNSQVRRPLRNFPLKIKNFYL